jgi:hypothetical protein
MASLRELQLGFVQAIRDPHYAPRFGRHLRQHGVRNAQRIQIYRNNGLAALQAALEAVYPVVARLVGTAFFQAAARDYIRSEPSRSGDIHAYGGHFARHLANLPAARELPYLADVARLEWIYHSLFHSRRVPALRVEALREVPEARYAALRLRLQPASRLFVSPYPVLRIWQVNRDDWQGDDTVRLDEGGVRLLALRAADGIHFIALSTGEYTLLQALGAARPLGEAGERALACEPELDIGAVLQRQFRLGTFAGWRL